MTLTHAKRAYRMFTHSHVDKATTRHNVRQWLKSVALLGDKWIMANPIQLKKIV